MTTVATIRQTYLNNLLDRIEGDTRPWTDAQAGQHITDALAQTWPDLGLRATGTVATTNATQVYTIPGSIGRISRISLERTTGGVTQQVGLVTSWRYYSDTQVIIEPLFDTDTTLALRFFGYKPFDVAGSDLPTRLENVIAMKAAALAFGSLEGRLVNSQRQQSLDSGRVVDYQQAAGLSAYWERRYQQAVLLDPARISYAPRRASRGC